MSVKSFFKWALIISAVVGVMILISVMYGPKCIVPGCTNRQEEGSAYCCLHRQHSEDSDITDTTDPQTSPYSNDNVTTTRKSTRTDDSYDRYDEGYDDVYMEEEYDQDRYDRDSDYEDGVDDAMDDLDEDL